MTTQISDRLHIDGRDMVVVAATGTYPVDPCALRLGPLSWSTANARGFYCHYAVRDQELYVAKLALNATPSLRERVGRGEGTPLLGARPTLGQRPWVFYNAPPEPVNFTGGIIAVAEPMTPDLMRPPHAHKVIREVLFEKGTLSVALDHSGLAGQPALAEAFLADYGDAWALAAIRNGDVIDPDAPPPTAEETFALFEALEKRLAAMDAETEG